MSYRPPPKRIDPACIEMATQMMNGIGAPIFAKKRDKIDAIVVQLARELDRS